MGKPHGHGVKKDQKELKTGGIDNFFQVLYCEGEEKKETIAGGGKVNGFCFVYFIGWEKTQHTVDNCK